MGTTTAIEQSVGGPARGEDVLALLVRAKRVRGTLPPEHNAPIESFFGGLVQERARGPGRTRGAGC
ncbi:MAG: hypothetical protein HOP15_04605 [Planctomycetes bacterium]|nr:hypothetical protein [Planctomycetota bacterium]